MDQAQLHDRVWGEDLNSDLCLFVPSPWQTNDCPADRESGPWYRHQSCKAVPASLDRHGFSARFFASFPPSLLNRSCASLTAREPENLPEPAGAGMNTTNMPPLERCRARAEFPARIRQLSLVLGRDEIGSPGPGMINNENY